MMDHMHLRRTPSESQTVRDVRGEYGAELYAKDRDVVAMHIGRYVIGWARLDRTLNMVAAHWTGSHDVDPQYAKMGANRASRKVEMLAEAMPTGWREGQALLRLTRSVNQYRNKLVHWSFAWAGHSDHLGDVGWHLSNPKKLMSGEIVLLSVESMRTEQAKLEVAGFALHHLVSETFWDGALVSLSVEQLNAHRIGPAIIDEPGTWNTAADYNAFVSMVESIFPS